MRTMTRRKTRNLVASSSTTVILTIELHSFIKNVPPHVLARIASIV